MQGLASRNNVSRDLTAMQKLLQGDGEAWRITELYNDCTLPCGKVVSMIRSCLQQSRDVGMWEHLETTERQVSDLHRLCVRPGAVVFDLILTRQKQFPTRLLATLTDATQVDRCLAVLQRHPCLLDEWSHSFLTEFDTRSKLVSEDARQELTAIAAHILTNTMGVESAHSRNLRRSRSRVHTHHMSLPEVALWTQGWAAPSHVVPPVPEDVFRILTVSLLGVVEGNVGVGACKAGLQTQPPEKNAMGESMHKPHARTQCFTV